MMAAPNGDRTVPAISVIIPHLNQQDALRRCLASLDAQDFEGRSVEIIVVDNGSRDRLDALIADFGHVRFDVRFDLEPAPGPGLARNRGVAVTTGNVLLFIDADCRADLGWIRSAVAALSQSDCPGIIGGDVRIDVGDRTRLTAFEAYESVFAYRQAHYICKAGFSGTGNLAMTRAIFERVGPFGGIEIAEDRDWGQRARAMGLATRYCPEMIVYHPARASFAELCEKWRRHVAHDLAKHRGNGGSASGWTLRALAMPLSVIPHSLTVLTSKRLAGFVNKLRAIGLLASIRFFRCADMLRQAHTPGHGGPTRWNR